MKSKPMEMSSAPANMIDEHDIPDHEVEGAAHDLMRAEKHKANKPLMKKVARHLNSQKKAISSIQDLKEMRNDAMKPEMDEASEMDAPPMKKK